MYKQSKLLGMLLICAVLITSSGCRRQAAKKPVVASPKKLATVQGVEAYGIIKARDYKDINLEFPAQIIKVPVKDGQNVKQGEALIYLNISDFQAQLKNKANELNVARFELLKREKTLRDAEAAYAKAVRTLKDKEKLLGEGALSQQEVDDYEDVVLEKERAVTDIRLSLNQSAGVDGIGVLHEKVRVLEYDLARMRQKLNQSFLKGNVIVSDFANAVVYDIKCAAGYSVGYSENEPKLLSIMNLDSLYVSAEVAEEFIKDVRAGAQVTIIPVADKKRRYHGRVIRIADMAVKNNGETNVAVEISVANTDGFLRPNFNVDVEIGK